MLSIRKLIRAVRYLKTYTKNDQITLSNKSDTVEKVIFEVAVKQQLSFNYQSLLQTTSDHWSSHYGSTPRILQTRILQTPQTATTLVSELPLPFSVAADRCSSF